MNIVAEKKFHLTGHSGSIYSIIAGDSDHTFFSAGSEGVVVKWNLNDIESPIACAKVEGQIFALLYLKEMNHLVIGTMGGSMHVIDLNEKKEIHNITYHQQSIFDIQFFEDKILVCSKDGTLTVWQASDYSLLKSIRISEVALRQLNSHPTKKELAIGSSDNNIYILNADDFSVEKTLSAPENSVFSVCYSNDGNYLLTGSRDAQLCIWNAEKNYSLMNKIPAHLYTINHITYISNGICFATAGRDKAVKIWDAETFELKKVLDKEKYNGHINSVNKLCWNETHQLLFSASDDRSIIAWKISIN
jgi:WD40 repeat protein